MFSHAIFTFNENFIALIKINISQNCNIAKRYQLNSYGNTIRFKIRIQPLFITYEYTRYIKTTDAKFMRNQFAQYFMAIKLEVAKLNNVSFFVVLKPIRNNLFHFMYEMITCVTSIETGIFRILNFPISFPICNIDNSVSPEIEYRC